MKNYSKKIWAILILCCMLFSISMPALAESTPQLTAELVFKLDANDFATGYDYLIDYKENHPTISYEELNEVAICYYAHIAEQKNISVYGYNDVLIEKYNDLNTDELALAIAHPLEASAVFAASKVAKAETSERYWAGLYLGNGDAFRHAAWNALIVPRLYNIGAGSVNDCLARTKVWTDVHESGAADDPDLDAQQVEIDHQMDYHNNAVGRNAVIPYYNSSDTIILNQIQNCVDTGQCYRIKTDDNILDEEYMPAVKPWTLRSTNTVGKI